MSDCRGKPRVRIPDLVMPIRQKKNRNLHTVRLPADTHANQRAQALAIVGLEKAGVEAG
jgi:hypothetical protein